MTDAPMKTVLLMGHYLHAGERYQSGDVLDLPIDEAAQLVSRNRAIETVPPVEANGRRAEWLRRLQETVDGKARRIPDTEAAYRADFERWREWCAERDVPAVPVDPVWLVRYLAHRAADGAARSSLNRYLTSIAWFHERSSHPPVRHVLTAIVTAAMRRVRAQALEAVPPQTGTEIPHEQMLWQRVVELDGAGPDWLSGIIESVR